MPLTIVRLCVGSTSRRAVGSQSGLPAASVSNKRKQSTNASDTCYNDGKFIVGDTYPVKANEPLISLTFVLFHTASKPRLLRLRVSSFDGSCPSTVPRFPLNIKRLGRTHQTIAKAALVHNVRDDGVSHLVAHGTEFESPDETSAEDEQGRLGEAHACAEAASPPERVSTDVDRYQQGVTRAVLYNAYMSRSESCPLPLPNRVGLPGS